MRIFEKAEGLTAVLQDEKCRGRRVGFVPTMGALHAGHLSLVERARRQCDRVVVSIFVNPLQFGPQEDFNRYPRSFEADQRLLERSQVEYLFHPSAEELYSTNFETRVQMAELSSPLCGRSRPGHFEGVVTVLAKLFNIAVPDYAFFGEKDGQQLVIVRTLVRDLNFPIRIVACPTVREPDGLALSSRNSYLTTEERRAAPALFAGLSAAAACFAAGERAATPLLATVGAALQQQPLLRIDYIELVDTQCLRPIQHIEGREAMLAAAVYLGRTRLIDNVVLRP